MPEGPRCLRWWMVRPSGPAARELPLFRMALETRWVVNGEREWSSGHLRRSSRLTLRAVGSEEWGVMEVEMRRVTRMRYGGGGEVEGGGDEEGDKDEVWRRRGGGRRWR